MKIRLLLALVGLAISFAFPTFAQQKDTITDPQIVQQIHAVAAKSDEIFKKGDAAARAAMFTEDAVLVTERGTFYGRSAIEKYYADTFQKWHFLKSSTTYAPNSPHAIGTDGNAVWENGEWSCTIQGQSGDPIEVNGFWSSVKVREGDTWKIRMNAIIHTPPPAATGTPPPSPTITPTNQ